ncbi:hypothetical protein OTK49_00140 [Vibrio coralliirubri]|uniref:hypothetical protein n=1 Tax=Vibrio coralliirubri TaxID=1516159 RepID=UPI0022835D59|nr:hypothetical protein [Vibrio coralliirubri]MCY9860949.1 hypothetical protein [Vibrio coralliirubri]
MKYHDVVSIAGESLDILRVADDCSMLRQADPSKIKTVSDIITSVDDTQRAKVLGFIATSSFVSLSILFNGVIKENSTATRKFFDSIDDAALSNSVGRVLNEKLKFFYAIKIIASTFDDQNLLNLKKVFTDNE